MDNSSIQFGPFTLEQYGCIRDIVREELDYFFRNQVRPVSSPVRRLGDEGTRAAETGEADKVKGKMLEIIRGTRLSWLHFQVIKSVYFAEMGGHPHDSHMYKLLGELVDEGIIEHEKWTNGDVYKLVSAPRYCEEKSEQTAEERLLEIREKYPDREFGFKTMSFLMRYQKAYKLSKIKEVLGKEAEGGLMFI